MKFIVLVKATPESESPSPKVDMEMLAAMGKFNDELSAAGVMKDADGLKPSSFGARINFSAADITASSVTNGPFAANGELIAGYWIWECASLEEAIGWAKKCPHPHPGHDTNIEIRPVYSEEEFTALFENQ